MISTSASVHRTIMLYEGAREHATRQASHRRVMSAVLNAGSTRVLRCRTTIIATAREARALAELALDLFETATTRMLPAPAQPRSGSMSRGPELLHAVDAPGFPALTLPTGLSDAACPTECTRQFRGRRRWLFASPDGASGDRFQRFSG